MRKLFLLLVLLPLRLLAQTQCTQYASVDYPDIPWSSTYQGACSAIFARVSGAWAAANAPSGSITSCTTSYVTVNRAGSIYNFGIKSRTAACGDTVCQSQQGQSKVVNFTVGYTRSPNIDTDPGWKLVGPPNQVVQGGLLCNPASPCELRFEGFSDADKAWQSLAPTPSGLYRVSLDISATVTGQACTPTASDNAALSKTAPIPPCPGFTGEVNGVPGCYGTASSPTSNDISAAKPKPPEAGNPTAGEKPASGEGSGTGGAGRTPSTGDGGPAGGPAAAAGSGTKPDGTVPKPDAGKEQAACGAPGQAKCGIDEGGTPGKFDGDKAALDGWKSAVEANRNTIKDADGSFFNSYSMFFAAPPIVPCEPIELPNDQVLTRQCDVVEGTRSVMSYIWALAALWICLGWIREAI